MNAIAGPASVRAYAERHVHVGAGGIVAIFLDKRCCPLGTSTIWSAGRQVGRPIEQVQQALRLGAAGLVLVCDRPATATSASSDVEVLKRLASDHELTLLDVVCAAGDWRSAASTRPKPGNGSAVDRGERQRRLSSG